MTNTRGRDYRYVTQKFFDRWNDRIVTKYGYLLDRVKEVEREFRLIHAFLKEGPHAAAYAAFRAATTTN